MSMERNKLEAELAQMHARSYGWALRCCYEDGEAAAEVLQTTYVKILGGKARFSGQSLFRTWLFSIIRFTAIDHFKADKKRQTMPLNMVRRLPEELHPVYTHPEGDPPEQHAVLQGALTQLSLQQQQVLHLVFYQDCSIREAAAIMQIQVGTARTHYERGKRQLKELLIKAGFREDVY